MYDPLQASAPPVQQQQQQGSPSRPNAVSPPPTPSKASKALARPPPYQRPPPLQNQQQQQGHSVSGQQSSPGQSPFVPGPGYSGVRSQSPLAPRPPLPGQVQRPVSPLHFQSQGQQQQYFPTASSSSSSSSSFVAPPPEASANAWASSPPSSSSAAFNSREPPPAPAPLNVPTPTTAGFASSLGPGGVNSPPQQQRSNSPGFPRSPIAETPRSVLGENGQGSHVQQQQQRPLQPRAPPFVRIRVHGIDRAKKELGVKLDAQTNIPTYHRNQSPIFSRTYAEFSQLHAALSANHPETILPAMPLPQTSAVNEEEEDRFLRGIFQKFVDRITRDRTLVTDDELRGFVEADFGYTPLTRAKKLKSTSGFLSRSTSKTVLTDDPDDLLLSSKVQSAALESAFLEVTKSLEKDIKASVICATAYADVCATLNTLSVTETHPPLSHGMKKLADSMRNIAELEVGQSNASALILGDGFAYNMVEARAAKDALLQRQYNLDELHASIKSTINKRRTIEKLRTSGGIKSERVNEALDDLDEAQKQETQLQNRVQAISTNLRPALQTHLRIMNDDVNALVLQHAKTMLAYENRKLNVFGGMERIIGDVKERGESDVVMYHQQPQAQPSTSATLHGTTLNAAASTSSASPAAGMSPSTSSQGSLHQQAQQVNPKFLEKDAEIRALVLKKEQQEQEQIARLKAQQYQIAQEKQIAEQRRRKEEAARQQSAAHNGQSPLNGAAGAQQYQGHGGVPHLDASSRPQRTSSIGSPLPSASGSQSMFLPSSLASPSSSAGLPPSSSSAFDPLSGLASGPGQTQVPAQVSAQLRQQQPQNHYQQQQQHSKMSQSAFLPGRQANLDNGQRDIDPLGASVSSIIPRNRPNAIDDRKVQDARKAASLLAGAF